MSIFNTIKNERDNFLHNSIEIVPGFNFNQHKTIEQIYKYYYSQFLENKKDETGYDLLFFNLSRPRVKAWAKNIDIDTKDFLLKGERGMQDYLRSWLGRIRLREWMQNNGLADKLNRETYDLSIFGACVWKKVRSEIEKVDLRYLYHDPTVRSLKDSAFTIEKHILTREQMREKQGAWKNVEDAMNKYGTNKEKNQKYAKQAEYEIYERYGWIKESDYYEDEGKKAKSNEWVYSKFIVIGIDSNSGRENNKGLVLHKELNPKYPYMDCLLPDRIDGRWLPVGVVEELFEPQIARNEVFNWKRGSMRFASMQLFQTEGESIADNILEDLVSGDVINGQIDRVDTQERNLGAFQSVEQENDNQSDLLTQAFEIVQGDEMPSGTPFRLAAALNKNANKYFNLVRQQRGIFWSQLINQWIFPVIKRDLNKKYILEITEDLGDLQKINEIFRKAKVAQKVKELLSKGVLITRQSFGQITVMIDEYLSNSPKEKFIDIPENYFDFKGKVDTHITNEKFDKQVQLETIKSIIQLIAPNPQILLDPVVAPFIYEIMEISGISPMKINLPRQQIPTQEGEQERPAMQMKPKSSLAQAEASAGLTNQQTT